MDQIKINLEEFDEAKVISFGEGDERNIDAYEPLNDAELEFIDSNHEYDANSRSSPPSDEKKFDDTEDWDDAVGPRNGVNDKQFPVMSVNGLGNEFGNISMLDFSETDGGTHVRSQAEMDLEQLSDVYEGVQIEMRDLKNRLRARTKLVETFRLAYLRDVVAIKHCLNFALTDTERKTVLNEYTGRLPSLDLTEALALYAPPNAHLRVKPCAECGGIIDVTMNDSEHVAKLTSIIGKLKEKEERLRITIATQDAEKDSMVVKHNADARQHADEKKFLYSELKQTKEKSAKIEAESLRINKLSTGYRDQIREMTEKIGGLEVKAQRLLEVEKECLTLKFTVDKQAAAMETGDSLAGELQVKLSEEQVLNKQKEKIIAERDATIKEYQTKLAVEEEKVKKLKGLNDYLERNYETSQVRIVTLEGELQDVKDEKRAMQEEMTIEMETLRNVAEELRTELMASTKNLEDTKAERSSLQGALSAAEQLIAQKQATIETRDKEIMAMAAEMEALQEELSAMKIFLSDTVASKKTPSRARRNRAATEEDYDDDELELYEEPADSLSATKSSTINPTETGSQAVLEVPAETETGPTAKDLSEVDLAEYKRKLLMRQSGGHASGVKDGAVVDYSSLLKPAPVARVPSVEADEDSVVSGIDSIAHESVDSNKGADVPKLEYSTATVAPPTVQAEPKKKHQANREAAAKTQIALLGPSDNATPGELMLRKDFMEAINTTLGSTGAKKAMNSGRDLMASYGALLTNGMSALWDGMLMAKRACDLLRRIDTYSAYLLKCTTEGTTDQQMGDMLSELVPKIGSNYNFTFSEEWQTDIDMDEQYTNLLDPSLDKEADLLFYKDYTALFGETKEEYEEGVHDTYKYLKKMQDFFDGKMLQLNKNLLTTVKEWSDAKTVQINFKGLQAKARAETKKEMQIIVDDLNKELGLANGRFDAAKQFSKSLETKLETVGKRLVALEMLPEKIAVAESELDILRRNKEAQLKTIEGLRADLKNKIEEFDFATQIIAQRDDKIKDMHVAITSSANAAVEYEQKFIFEKQLKEKVQGELKAVILKEETRVKGMESKYTDCVALMKTIAQQTEFLTPDMNVRHIAATGSGTIYARRPFGVTLVDASEVQTQSDIASNLRSLAGQQQLGSFAAEFTIGSSKPIRLAQTIAPGLPIAEADRIVAVGGVRSQARPPASFPLPMDDSLESSLALPKRLTDSGSGSGANQAVSSGSQTQDAGDQMDMDTDAVVGHMSVSIGSHSYASGHHPANIRSSETNTFEYVDGLSNKLMRESSSLLYASRPGSRSMRDSDDDNGSVGNLSFDSFSLKSVERDGRQASYKPSAPNPLLLLDGKSVSSSKSTLGTRPIAEYSRILVSQPLPKSRATSPISSSNVRSGTRDINPVDMLELARARLQQERQEHANSVRRMGADVLMSPLKAAGMRNIDNPLPTAAGDLGGNMFGTSTVGSGSRSSAKASGALANQASRIMSMSMDHLDLKMHESKMQTKLALNVGGHYKTKGGTELADAASISELKKKFFQKAK